MINATRTTGTGWLLVCLGLWAGCGSDGEADRYGEIAAAYEAERVATDVPGVAVAIVENGEVAFEQGFGTTDDGSGAPVTPATRFRFLNTAFASVALLQLVDHGLVGLDDPLLQHVPDFMVDGPGPYDSASMVQDIRISHLLLQTSGLQSGYYIETVDDWDDRADSVLDEYLTSAEFAHGHHMVAPPGEVVFESQLGIALLAVVVERVVRAERERRGEAPAFVPFCDYVRDNVFAPLGMTRTTYRVEDVEADGDFAYGVNADGSWSPTQHDNPWLRPVMGAWTTAHDMALFAKFLVKGNDAVLSRDLLDEALSPQALRSEHDRMPYGYFGGMSEGPCVVGGICPAQGDLRGLLVAGNFMGHTSASVIVPSRDFAVIHLANRESVANLDPEHPGAGLFPDADQLALTGRLSLPALAPDAVADDHEPDVYVGRYALDRGNSTAVTLRDGTLRLSSPSCDLEPRGSGVFGCDDRTGVRFQFGEDGRVKYLVTSFWVATPVPDEAE